MLDPRRLIIILIDLSGYQEVLKTEVREAGEAMKAEAGIVDEDEEGHRSLQ